MKSLLMPLSVLLGLAAAEAQSVKPGTIALVLFESTITTQNAPTAGPPPAGGGTRVNFTTTSRRFINRDILEGMRMAGLLDGTLTGWSLSRLADALGAGNLYATKFGRTAVAVPATLLTQPVAVGSVITGNRFTPASGPPQPNLLQRAHVTLNIRNEAGSGFGSSRVRWANFRSGATSTVVATQTDFFDVSGPSGGATGIVAGSYRVVNPRPVDLGPLLPVPAGN
jgi:hypothetical protein